MNLCTQLDGVQDVHVTAMPFFIGRLCRSKKLAWNHIFGHMILMKNQALPKSLHLNPYLRWAIAYHDHRRHTRSENSVPANAGNSDYKQSTVNKQ